VGNGKSHYEDDVDGLMDSHHGYDAAMDRTKMITRIRFESTTS
jgi:hypothetical protein